MTKLKVYIASPYTLGDVAQNVKVQIDAANRIMDYGGVPFAPLMAHFHHLIHPRTYEEWMEWDLQWLEACDCVLRLPGESSGADREVQRADELGKSIFFSFDALKRYLDITEAYG